MQIAEKKEIYRYKDGEYRKLDDLTVNEMRLKLEINGAARREIFCTPDELNELIWGHLYTQGYISCAEDVNYVKIDEKAAVAIAEISRDYINSDISGIQKKETEDCFFDVKMISANQTRFYDESTVQKETGGVHRCALCDNTGTLFASIDISRHNAFDKVVGKALLSGTPLHDKYIITSGRVPYDMVKKAITVNIPMIVSRSATTIAAIEAAGHANMTLLGFSRDDRFNIYCGKQRLY